MFFGDRAYQYFPYKTVDELQVISPQADSSEAWMLRG